MGLTSPLDITLKWWRVQFTCAGKSGIRFLYGPSPRAVSRVLRDHPSMFGLPSETVMVDRVTAAPGLEKAWQHNQNGNRDATVRD